MTYTALPAGPPAGLTDNPAPAGSAARPYTGRFAPSPTGPLHLGSLVAAMASYLDAKVHRGRWLVRIEDLDRDRNVAGVDRHILASLQRCGMQWDGDVTWQTRRTHLYHAALAQLEAAGAVYPCACSRKEIQDSQLRQGQAASALVYPGTCRAGLAPGKTARAIRLRTQAAPSQAPAQPLPPAPQPPARLPASPRYAPPAQAPLSAQRDGQPSASHLLCFNDRWHGTVCQDVEAEVGDFVIRRADGFWAYQLAVVVDDGAQGISDIVRGADLLDSTPRQIHLQHVLGLPQPSYLHVPVVANADGEKLSKQTGAQAFDNGAPPAGLLQSALLPAARFLELELQAGSVEEFWRHAVPAWERRLQQRGAAQARA